MEDIELIDIADDLLIVNKTTIDRLFQEENQNTLILYLFYYKTAKWQKHNPIKANDDYCKRCLHWGIDRLQLAKKRLKEMKLIEVIKRTTDKGRVQGWYVKVNYLIDETTIPKTTIPIKPQLVCQETNTINNNILNTNNSINIITKERFKKPTIEDIKKYCDERNNDIDPKKFFDYYEVNDWKDNKGNQVKNWKQKLITWEKHTYKTKEDVPSWFDKKLDTEEPGEELEELLKELSV